MARKRINNNPNPKRSKSQKARSIIARPCYNRFRAWKMHKMFHHFDEVLHSRKLDSHVVKKLTRYALKEAWYINKIHNQG